MDSKKNYLFSTEKRSAIESSKKKNHLMSTATNGTQPPIKKIKISSSKLDEITNSPQRQSKKRHSIPSPLLTHNKNSSLSSTENPKISAHTNQGRSPKESTNDKHQNFSSGGSIDKLKAKKQFSWVSLAALASFDACEHLAAPELIDAHRLADATKNSNTPEENEATKTPTTKENNYKTKVFSTVNLLKESKQGNQDPKNPSIVRSTKDKSNVVIKGQNTKGAQSSIKVLIRKPVKVSLTSSPSVDTTNSAQTDNPCNTIKKNSEIENKQKNNSTSHTETFKKISDHEKALAMNKNFDAVNRISNTIYKEATFSTKRINAINEDSTTGKNKTDNIKGITAINKGSTKTNKIIDINKKSTKSNSNTIIAINEYVDENIQSWPIAMNSAFDLDNDDLSLVNLSDIDEDQELLSKKIAAKNVSISVDRNDEVIIEEDFTINVPELTQNVR